MFLLAVPLFTWGATAAGIVIAAAESTTVAYLLGAAAVGAVGYGTHKLCQRYDINFSQEQPWYDTQSQWYETPRLKNQGNYGSHVYNQVNTNVGSGQQIDTETDQNGTREIEEVIQGSRKKPSFSGDKLEDKRHNPDQEALNEFVKESGKRGVSNADGDILLEWAKEYNFPARDDRKAPPHWVGGKHIHMGPKHVRVYD